jgi:hypothetical protein
MSTPGSSPALDPHARRAVRTEQVLVNRGCTCAADAGDQARDHGLAPDDVDGGRQAGPSFGPGLAGDKPSGIAPVGRLRPGSVRDASAEPVSMLPLACIIRK